mmetsp:Transcript_2976/g.5514  ORF Transcript_2976/g.5514 Transcript_2976/m.5514 type:complete len:249 (+) Transcript_2976:177-923(+)
MCVCAIETMSLNLLNLLLLLLLSEELDSLSGSQFFKCTFVRECVRALDTDSPTPGASRSLASASPSLLPHSEGHSEVDSASSPLSVRQSPESVLLSRRLGAWIPALDCEILVSSSDGIFVFASASISSLSTQFVICFRECSRALTGSTSSLISEMSFLSSADGFGRVFSLIIRQISSFSRVMFPHLRFAALIVGKSSPPSPRSLSNPAILCQLLESMNLCWRSCSAVGRSFGSLTRHCDTKSLSSADQ